MKKRILAYLLSATLVVGLVPATAWAEELPQQPDGAVLEEQQNDAEGGAIAPEVNPEETPETAPEDVPVVPEEDANGEGSDDSTVDETEGTTEDADSEEGANDEDGVVPEEKPEQVPMMTLAEAEPVATGVAMIGTQPYDTLAKAIEAVPTDDTETTITLTKDITDFATSDIVTIPNGANVVLDMNGKSITVTSDFTGRPIVNEGTLEVKGNGTIDSSASENGGYGAINNYGTLSIINGTYRGAKYSDASTIRNSSADAKLIIEDGEFIAATRAVQNHGKAIINGGRFIGTTCSSCNNQIWAYTIINVDEKSDMVINDGYFEGTQGAVSASFGSLIVNDGTFKTVDCDKKHGAIFYALYAAGENGKVECTINGGHFETVGKYACVLIGNDNTGGDGGINAPATAHIKGGTFVAPEGVPALKGAEKTGDPVITGGTFTSDVSKYLPKEGGYSIKEVNGKFIVDTVENNAVATVDGTYYNTLEQAFNVAADNGKTIVINKDIENQSKIEINDGKSYVVDLNNHNISFAKNSQGVCNSFYISHGSLELTGKGKVKEAENGQYYAPIMLTGSTDPSAKDYSVLTLGEGVTAEGFASVFVDAKQGCAYGVKAVLNGNMVTVEDPDKFTGYAVYINGSINKESGNVPEIIMSSSAKIQSAGVGIYAAGYGKWTINGSNITADDVGIEIRAGEMLLNNATITGNGIPTNVDSNGNGTTTSGAGIAVAQHATKLPILVTINGGTVSGYTALIQSNPENNSGDDVAKVKLDVQDGNFRTINGGKNAVSSENCTKFISGGYFTSDPTVYLADGHFVAESDKEGYFYKVTNDEPAEPPVFVTEEVKSEVSESIDEDIKKAISAVINKTEVTGIAQAVKQDAKQAIIDASGVKPDDNTPVEIEITVSVTATDANLTKDGTDNFVAYDVTPVAVVKVDGEESKAVPVSNSYLDGDKITIKLPVPAGLAVEEVEHTCADGSKEFFYETGNKIFTEENGVITIQITKFSEIKLSGKVSAVAKIGEQYYTTLEDAINHVKDGETITLVNECNEDIYVRSRISFTLDESVAELKGSINAGSRYRMRTEKVDDATTKYTFTKKKSSSSGSSSSSQEYKVTIADGIENGKVKVDPSKAEKGDKVTITVTPNKGYEINKVYAKDADGDKLELKDKGDGEYTFTMPDSKVEVKATFVKAEEEKPAEPEEISAAEKIVLTVNEKAAMVFGNVVVNDVAPIIRNDRTMLPIRFVAKNLGAEVTWDAQFQKVSITKDDLKIEIIIGSPVAFVNGENVTLDSPAFIENSRTYLPLRFVAENLGATVTWDAEANQVTIVPAKELNQ